MPNTKALFEIKHEDGVPYSDSDLFKINNPKKLDTNKPTAAIITWGNFKSSYNHIHGFVEEVALVLSKTHNIVWIGKEDPKNIQDLDNFYVFNLKGFHHLNKNEFLRVKEAKPKGINNYDYNNDILLREFEKSFKNVKFDKVIFGNSTFYELPLTGYFKEYKHLVNEFHDYTGDDPKEIEKRNNCALEIAKNYNRRVSVLAFSMFQKNIFTNLCIWLNQKFDVNMNYSFVLDPVVFHKVFEIHNLPFKYYYFNNDKRGTRNFEQFPIAHLQHIINEDKHYSAQKDIQNKSKKFFWMGSMIHERGIRSSLWDTFFEDLNIDDSTLWVPIRTNGIFMNKKQETSKFGQDSKKKAFKRFPKLVKKIERHPMFDGHLLPIEVTKNIAKYKYTFILRCVSIEDSLNYRPVHYTYLRILPFIDPAYDPDYIQIPKNIQDKLIVHSAQEIEDKVKYFENHPEEREQLLDQLYDHFKIDDFKNNYEELILSYFK